MQQVFTLYHMPPTHAYLYSNTFHQYTPYHGVHDRNVYHSY